MKKTRWVLVLLLCLLAGCRTELYSKVSEQEANEMIGALSTGGIGAHKRSTDGKTWSVEVEEDEIAEALDVLRVQGLPRDRHQSLGEVFKREGLVSTPAEERIRFIYAMSQELSYTLTQIDGVVTARVHVVIPANDPLAERIHPSSASVFIKHRRGVSPQAITPAVKNLVMRSIEGLSYDNISLSFFQADVAPPRAARPRGWWQRAEVLQMALAALAATLVVAGVLLHGPTRARLMRWVPRRRPAAAAAAAVE